MLTRDDRARLLQAPAETLPTEIEEDLRSLRCERAADLASLLPLRVAMAAGRKNALEIYAMMLAVAAAQSRRLTLQNALNVESAITLLVAPVFVGVFATLLLKADSIAAGVWAIFLAVAIIGVLLAGWGARRKGLREDYLLIIGTKLDQAEKDLATALTTALTLSSGQQSQN